MIGLRHCLGDNSTSNNSTTATRPTRATAAGVAPLSPVNNARDKDDDNDYDDDAEIEDVHFSDTEDNDDEMTDDARKREGVSEQPTCNVSSGTEAAAAATITAASNEGALMVNEKVAMKECNHKKDNSRIEEPGEFHKSAAEIAADAGKIMAETDNEFAENLVLHHDNDDSMMKLDHHRSDCSIASSSRTSSVTMEEEDGHDDVGVNPDRIDKSHWEVSISQSKTTNTKKMSLLDKANALSLPGLHQISPTAFGERRKRRFAGVLTEAATPRSNNNNNASSNLTCLQVSLAILVTVSCLGVFASARLLPSPPPLWHDVLQDFILSGVGMTGVALSSRLNPQNCSSCRVQLSSAAVLVWGLQCTMLSIYRRFMHADEFAKVLAASSNVYMDSVQFWSMAYLRTVMFVLPYLVGTLFSSSSPTDISFHTIGGLYLFFVGWLVHARAVYERLDCNPFQVTNACFQGLWLLSQHPDWAGKILMCWGLFLMNAPAVLAEQQKQPQGNARRQWPRKGWFFFLMLLGPLSITTEMCYWQSSGSTSVNMKSAAAASSDKMELVQRYVNTVPLIFPRWNWVAFQPVERNEHGLSSGLQQAIPARKRDKKQLSSVLANKRVKQKERAIIPVEQQAPMEKPHKENPVIPSPPANNHASMEEVCNGPDMDLGLFQKLLQSLSTRKESVPVPVAAPLNASIAPEQDDTRAEPKPVLEQPEKVVETAAKESISFRSLLLGIRNGMRFVEQEVLI